MQEWDVIHIPFDLFSLMIVDFLDCSSCVSCASVEAIDLLYVIFLEEVFTLVSGKARNGLQAKLFIVVAHVVERLFLLETR